MVAVLAFVDRALWHVDGTGDVRCHGSASANSVLGVVELTAIRRFRPVTGVPEMVVECADSTRPVVGEGMHRHRFTVG